MVQKLKKPRLLRERERSHPVDTPVKVEPPAPTTYRPETTLGRKLWEIRKRIVASGEPLLSWDDIEREVAERRGEVNEGR